MKFIFEEEGPKQITTHIPIPKLSPNLIGSKSQYSQVKAQLTSAVHTFKDQIDREIKAQLILQYQITTLTEQLASQSQLNAGQSLTDQGPLAIKPQFSSEQFPHKQMELDIQQSKQIKSDKILQEEKQLMEYDKVSKKQKQQKEKARSIKSELMTKGYPVVHKAHSLSIAQSNKTKLPYRFNFNN